MPNFRSDNETPVAEPIMQAIAAANQGTAWAYAEDDWSMRLDAAFSELFEAPTRVLPLPTGTVANSIALATVSPPWGTVFCHEGAHIYNDESGCPEFYGNGLRLVPIKGSDGKIGARALEEAIRGSMGHGVHSYSPAALSLTQSTEAGTVYNPGHIRELCSIARKFEMATHMDGARFGNAIAQLGCSPAEATWKAGVDMLSFGASKNGCMAAEALLFFGEDPDLDTAERLRKRGGHLYSKMRYLSCQLLAYIENGLWLELAGHANAQAAAFAAAVNNHPSASLEFPVEANEVFVRWNAENFRLLEAADIEFLGWPGRDDLARFVFGHTTQPEDTHALIDALQAIP